MPNHPQHNAFAAFRFAADVQPAPVPWLWPARIPLAKLTLLVGDPGVGKSLLTTDLAARVSAGRPWPDQPIPDPRTPDPSHSAPSVPSVAHPAGVVIVSAEDRLEDVLYPRLAAAGANLASVCVLEGVTDTLRSSRPAGPLSPRRSPVSPPSPFTLSEHVDVLAEAVRAVANPRLVILDPLPALLAPVSDFSCLMPHANAKISPDGLVTLLNALADIAHTYAVAIVAVTHCAKSATKRPLYRARGSIAFVAAARSVLFLTAHPTDQDARVLLSVKSVYASRPPPLTFRITCSTAAPGCVPAPRLDWKPCGTAAPGCDPARPVDPLNPEPRTLNPQSSAFSASSAVDLFDLPPDAQSALADACAWLTDALAAGPRPVRQLHNQARKDGISPTTLRRAKRMLAVRSTKPDANWLWTLPADDTR